MKDRPRVRLVVFDCDGTLVDSQSTILAAMGQALGELGLPQPPAAAVRQVVGLSLDEAAAQLLPKDDPVLRQRVVDGYREAYSQLKSDPKHGQVLFPGARDVLEQLHQEGYLLGVATGKSRHGLIYTLDQFGLLTLFASLQTADDAPSKPHPGMILNAMEATGSLPAATVMVGDTSFDIEAARNAGARGIGVAWGNHPESELHAAGADAVLDDFSQLRSHLGPPE